MQPDVSRENVFDNLRRSIGKCSCGFRDSRVVFLPNNNRYKIVISEMPVNNKLFFHDTQSRWLLGYMGVGQEHPETADSIKPCQSGTMYGMLLESIQHFIKEIYGESAWQQVLEHAGLRNMIFSTHKVYQDSIMNDVAGSCAHVLKTGTAEDFMFFFGKCFVNFFSHYGYDKIIRVSGRHYRDFLNGIDNLHETMRFSYPRLQSPSFYVGKEDENGCILNYRSRRRGFTQYVVGQLKQCAMKFYNVEVEVIVLEERIVSIGCHVIYRLNFDNQGFQSPHIKPPISGTLNTCMLPGKIFFKVFPFCVVFDSDMIIQSTGPNLKRLFGDQLINTDVRKTFQLRRPIMAFTWQNVLCLQKVVFELETLTVLNFCLLSEQFICNCKDRDTNHKPLSRTVILRGQMKLIDDWKSVAFLCTPLIGNLEDMEALSVYINDLSLHDNSRDMVLAGFQHASQLEHLIEEQMDKSKLIGDNLHKLDIWRQKSESLLYSMIPKSIGVRLKNGVDPVDTCETFDQVTILFSYIIGFMDICINVSALKVVECINKVFTLFDLIVDKYNVFKVETLGDAVYMVAGGVPDRTPEHAVNVAGLALELLQQATQLTNPATRQRLKIRIGMHTGGVVAGVVGKRMPQYCLFGDAVNTAARMQTNSESGRIHISEPCHRCLKASEFVTVFRGHLNIKGKGEMKTYWLVGKRDDPQSGQVCAILKAERCQKYIKQQTQLSTESYDLHGIHANLSCANLGGMTGETKGSCDSILPGDEEEDTISPGTPSSSGNVTPRLPFRFTLDSETPSRPGTPSLVSPGLGKGEITPEALQMAISTSARSRAPQFLLSPPSPLNEEVSLPCLNNASGTGSSPPSPRSNRLCGTSDSVDSLPYSPDTPAGDLTSVNWSCGNGDDEEQLKLSVKSESSTNGNQCESGDKDKHLRSDGFSGIHIESDTVSPLQGSDGNRALLKSDGSNAEIRPDGNGTCILLKSCGNGTLLMSGGSNTERKPDGNGILLKSDGSIAEMKPDGNGILLKSGGNGILMKSDGSNAERKHDGNGILLKSDGSNAERKHDGNGILLKSGGSNAERKHDGNGILLKSGGSNAERKHDGNGILLKSGGNNAERKSDGNGTILKSDGSNAERKPDGNDTILLSDGSNAERKPVGNGKLLKSDGSNAERKPDGNGILLKSDGNSTLLKSGGNNILLKSDGNSTLLKSGGNNILLKSDGNSALPQSGNGSLDPHETESSTKVLHYRAFMNSKDDEIMSIKDENSTSKIEINVFNLCPILQSELPELEEVEKLTKTFPNSKSILPRQTESYESLKKNQQDTKALSQTTICDSGLELKNHSEHFRTSPNSLKKVKISKVTELRHLFETNVASRYQNTKSDVLIESLNLQTGQMYKAENMVNSNDRNYVFPRPITTETKPSCSTDASWKDSKVSNESSFCCPLKLQPLMTTSRAGHELKHLSDVTTPSSHNFSMSRSLESTERKHKESQISKRLNFFSPQNPKPCSFWKDTKESRRSDNIASCDTLKYNRGKDPESLISRPTFGMPQSSKSSSGLNMETTARTENKLFNKTCTNTCMLSKPKDSKPISTTQKASKKETLLAGVVHVCESRKARPMECKKTSERVAFGKLYQPINFQVTNVSRKGPDQKDNICGSSLNFHSFQKSSQKKDAFVRDINSSSFNSVNTQTLQSPPEVQSELFLPPLQKTVQRSSMLYASNLTSGFLSNKGDNKESTCVNVNGEIPAPQKSESKTTKFRQKDGGLKSEIHDSEDIEILLM